MRNFNRKTIRKLIDPDTIEYHESKWQKQQNKGICNL